MKKSLFLALCILGLYGCGQQRPVVIERPVFDVWNSTTLEIDKIEMSDSATVFFIDAYFRPFWWIRIDKETYIRESGSNEKMLITGSEGINLDEQTYMPESGTISFKLFFPPLKKGITKIDFIESDCPDCFKIWGINLLPNTKVKIDPIPRDVAKVSSKPLPTPKFSLKPTKVNGKIFGYFDGAVPNGKITVYTNSIITGERIETEFLISKDGSFGGEITPGLLHIVDSSAGNIFLVPGEEVKIYVDFKKRTRFQSRYRTDKEPSDSIHTYVSGSFTSTELEAINQSTRNLFDYLKLMYEVVNMNPDEYKQYLLSIMDLKINEIKQKNYSDNTLMMMENYVKLNALGLLMRYEFFLTDSYRQVNNIKREDWDKITFTPPKPDETYYSFLKEIINDNLSYHPDYSYLINWISRIDYFNLPDGKNKPAKERFEYFKEKFAPVVGTDKGIIFDLIQTRFYGQQLEEIKFYTDAEKQEIRDVFSNKPDFAQVLIAENDKMVALIAANKENKESVVHDTPDVSLENMFDNILSNYKGKVVVVDFWATWCGPCINAMKTMKPLKEEMKDKDIVFLYLTGETSPLATWIKTYPTISGEHYRVSEEQWRYWYKVFGIQGIPTYMVYNREGEQLAKYTGYPGNDTLRKAIEKGL